MLKQLKANYPKAYKELKANKVDFRTHNVIINSGLLILVNKKTKRDVTFHIKYMGWE